MGIFSDSSREDVQTIGYIVDAALAAYARESAKRPGVTDYEVTTNDRFEFISEAGDRILRIIEHDDAIIRAATLVVLCNAAFFHNKNLLPPKPFKSPIARPPPL